MSFASNFLQLLFSLVVGIASVVGAVLIIVFLLAVPRNDFEDDDHDASVPVFQPIATMQSCPVQEVNGTLPFDCTLTNQGVTVRQFSSTACDNTLCDQCTLNQAITCCCRTDTTSSFEFICDGAAARTITQPETCSCQPCEDLELIIMFRVTSSLDNSPIVGAQITIDSSTPITTTAIGEATAVRLVSDRSISVMITATDHAVRTFDVELLPPSPVQIEVILSRVFIQSLGSNDMSNLTIMIGEVATIGVAQNSLVDDNNITVTEDISARTIFFATEENSTYSDDFPVEISTSDDSGVTTLYEARVLARTDIIDQNNNLVPIGLNNSLNLLVNFINFDTSGGVTVYLLLFNESTMSWRVESALTFASTKKRQVDTTGEATLPTLNLFWAIGVPVEQSNICYLQARAFLNDIGETGVTVSLEQFRSEFFFRSSAITGDGNALLGNSVCLEALCGDVAGTINAEMNEEPLVPSTSQPAGMTVSDNNEVTFTTSDEGTTGSPFYVGLDECRAANGDNNGFVRFNVQIPSPSGGPIPPVSPGDGFWFIRVEVLGCFESNRASTISIDPVSGQASVFTSTVTELAGADLIDIPAQIIPQVCDADQVTARTVCLEAYSNSTVTVQVEPNDENNEIGNLCFLSAVTDNLDTLPGQLERVATIDLTTNVGNEMAGLYFNADSRGVALSQCLNQVSNQLSPLDGIFAQFECFARPADSVTVELPDGCLTLPQQATSFSSQACSEVPCTTPTGPCAEGSGTSCCYRALSTISVGISCAPINPFTLTQPELCSCQSCEDVDIEVEVTVVSSGTGEPITTAMVDVINNEMMPTDQLGMFTITAPVSDGVVIFTISAMGYVPVEMHRVDLIPPGPIRIRITLSRLTTTTQGGTSSETINVADIAAVEYDGNSVTVVDNGQPFGGTVTSLTNYIAAENRLSFDILQPPDVVTSGPEFYAVRIIAATRLRDNDVPLTTSTGVVTAQFTAEGNLPGAGTLSLLTFDSGTGQWSSVPMDAASPNNGLVATSASLSDTELLWAIGDPLDDDMVCYVQVRTFRRNNPLSVAEVEVVQFFTQFGEPFFFKSTRNIQDSAGPVSHAACLPMLCGETNSGMIRAIYHVYLDANPNQPNGLTEAGKAVNFSITAVEGGVFDTTGTPFFSTESECIAAGQGPYARFDLPIPNPPPTDIEPDDNANGFVFLRASWYDCLGSNMVSTISSDLSENLLAINSIVVTKLGDFEAGIEDPVSSGGLAISCTDNMMDVTTRDGCIRVQPNANITLQVETHLDSNMRIQGNNRCGLNQTIDDFMLTSTGDRVVFDLGAVLTQLDPSTNKAALNNMGIYFDQFSSNVAFSQCMNASSSDIGQLSGSVALFSCFTE